MRRRLRKKFSFVKSVTVRKRLEVFVEVRGEYHSPTLYQEIVKWKREMRRRGVESVVHLLKEPQDVR